MTCRELVDFIDAYRSDELSGRERALFEQHLSECEQCRRYLDSYEATIELARAALDDPDAPVPDQVPDSLVEAILRSWRSHGGNSS